MCGTMKHFNLINPELIFNDFGECERVEYNGEGEWARCGYAPIVTIRWSEKVITRNNRAWTDKGYCRFCEEHLLEAAKTNTPEGQIIRDERLRIVTMTGINICGD